MNRKTIVILLIILALMGIIGYLAMYNNVFDNNVQHHNVNSVNKTTIEVSSTSPYNLKEMINEIKTEKYYKDYNNDTLTWMESLSQNNVFLSNNTLVIMDNNDASKVHHNTVDITDVCIVEKIECLVIENHSLGTNRAYDVLLVENVTDLGNKTYYYEV